MAVAVVKSRALTACTRPRWWSRRIWPTGCRIHAGRPAETEVKEARDRVRARSRTRATNSRRAASRSTSPRRSAQGVRASICRSHGDLAASGQIPPTSQARRIRRRTRADRRTAPGARALAMALALAPRSGSWCCPRNRPARRHWPAVVEALGQPAARCLRWLAGRPRSSRPNRMPCRLRRTIPTLPTSKARPPPSARSKSPRQAAIRCCCGTARHRQVDAGRALSGILPAMDETERWKPPRCSRSTAVSSNGTGSAGHSAHRTIPHPRWRCVGGRRQSAPGEISLAHHGVLFLDELPEFSRQVLEVLREPLETATSPFRARRGRPTSGALPAGGGHESCPAATSAIPPRLPRHPDQIARYRGRISGPLLDRSISRSACRADAGRTDADCCG